MSDVLHHFIVVLGREWKDGQFLREPAECRKKQINNNTVIISTPDASNLKGTHMMDLMALTFSGPHLFLVRLEEGKQQYGELRKNWEKVFGEDISHNMIYITDRDYGSLPHIIFGDIKFIKQCKEKFEKDISYPYKFGARLKMVCFDEILKYRMEQIERAAEMNQSINPQGYRNSVPGVRPKSQQPNQVLYRGSGTSKRKQSDYMTTEMETDQSSSRQDFASPVSGGQQKSQPLTLVLFGETGSGKSASGNTILGKMAFISKPSSTPVTTECTMVPEYICGTVVTVIDTPDFFDEDLEKPSTHIKRCRQLCEGGLCVYLLVIQIGRFTEGERDILERLEEALQTRIRNRAIILFTHGDDLKSHIDEYVKGTNQFLQQLIVNCGKRYQVISNSNSYKREVEKQVKELMGKIVQLVQETDRATVFPEYDAENNPCVIA